MIRRSVSINAIGGKPKRRRGEARRNWRGNPSKKEISRRRGKLTFHGINPRVHRANTRPAGNDLDLDVLLAAHHLHARNRTVRSRRSCPLMQLSSDLLDRAKKQTKPRKLARLTAFELPRVFFGVHRGSYLKLNEGAFPPRVELKIRIAVRTDTAGTRLRNFFPTN